MPKTGRTARISWTWACVQTAWCFMWAVRRVQIWEDLLENISSHVPARLALRLFHLTDVQLWCSHQIIQRGWTNSQINSVYLLRSPEESRVPRALIREELWSWFGGLFCYFQTFRLWLTATLHHPPASSSRFKIHKCLWGGTQVLQRPETVKCLKCESGGIWTTTTTPRRKTTSCCDPAPLLEGSQPSSDVWINT